MEDFSAPDCFLIEEQLKELMDIPVYHNDLHGTAIVCLASVINVCQITKRKIASLKVAINGSGAQAISCARMLNAYGVPKENITVCD